MQRITEYLKERNIPKDSLEANSILEGYELGAERTKSAMIKKAVQFIHETIYTWSGDYYGKTWEQTRKEYIERFKQAMQE